MSHPARGAWIEITRRGIIPSPHFLSHPARGAWIEMGIRYSPATPSARRTPQGVRGLKWRRLQTKCPSSCRTPQGVRGLKYIGHTDFSQRRTRRTPQGVRGLKLMSAVLATYSVSASHPARGAWIEIQRCRPRSGCGRASHPARGAWIEMRESCCRS